MTHVLDIFQSQHVSCVFSWTVNSKNHATRRYRAWLKRAGFLNLPYSDAFLVKLLAEEQKSTVNPIHLDQWFITLIYSEGAG